ncbi:unnamed protein product [Linum tenue]|uniref:Ribosomal protein L34Ae n=1 Tax=Linum tenue TaxID=586396 RepID=A0AAV0HT66_9ROSI|nr:unnamed protein product [Linum tenue]
MAILARCWLIVESRVIPNGFLKWFFLSFYIHPVFLVFCQILLWLKILLQCLVSLFSYPLNIISHTTRLLHKLVITIVSTAVNICRAEKSEQVGSSSSSSTPVAVVNNSYCYCTEKSVSDVVSTDSCNLRKLDVLVQPLLLNQPLGAGSEEDVESGSDEDHVGGGGGFIDSSSPSSMVVGGLIDSPSQAEDDDDGDLVEGRQSTDCIYSSSLLAGELNRQQEEEEEEQEVCVDAAFYQMYLERMRWFDVLNQDRTSGVSAVLNKQVDLCNKSPFEKIQLPEDFPSSPFNFVSPLSKIEKKRLMQSMENDFELIYVAQSCLSWEALRHQYKKLEALASQENSSSSSSSVLCDAHNIGQQFQNFEVLLERFMEDERSHGKRVWNYVRARFALDSLLQVPHLSVTVDREGRGEGTLQVKDVFNILEKCINTFWTFITTDTIKKKPWWKLRSSLISTSCLEDLRDMRLLYDLTRQFRKKEMWLRDLQGKQRRWLRKMESHVEEESERKEILFTLIDMKLISRVLRLSVITTCQLKWCQEKLDKIECQDGKIVRHCSRDDALLLFPP